MNTALFLSILLSFSVQFGALAVDDEDIFAESGENVEIMCTGKSSEDLDTVLWTKDGEEIANGIVRKDVNRLATTLVLSGVMPDDVGLYECFMRRYLRRRVYLYVRSPKLLVPVKSNPYIVNVSPNQQSVIPCRPTFPDVKISVYKDSTEKPIDIKDFHMEYDEKVGFIIIEGNLAMHNGQMKCLATKDDLSDSLMAWLHFSMFSPNTLPNPKIRPLESVDWNVGDEREMICEVRVSRKLLPVIRFTWRIPALSDAQFLEEDYSVERGRIIVERRAEEFREYSMDLTLVSTVKINPVSLGDQGKYSCELTNRKTDEVRKATERVRVFDKSSKVHWDTSAFNDNVTVSPGGNVKWVLGIHTLFKPRIEWHDPSQGQLWNDPKKYVIIPEKDDFYEFIIMNIDVSDMGEYKIKVYDDDNDILQGELSMWLYVKAAPMVSFNDDVPTVLTPDDIHKIHCSAKGFPTINSTNIKVYNCSREYVCKETELEPKEHLLEVVSKRGINEIVEFTASFKGFEAGYMSCHSCNAIGCSSDRSVFVINDIRQTIAISKTVKIEDGVKTLTLICTASKFYFSGIIWEKFNAETNKFIDVRNDYSIITERFTHEDKSFSLLSKATFKPFKTDLHNGLYRCNGVLATSTAKEFLLANLETEVNITLTEKELAAPRITGSSFTNGSKEYVKKGENFTLICQASGNPEPFIEWRKKGRMLAKRDDENKYIISPGDSTGRLTIIDFKPNLDATEFSCHAINDLGVHHASIQLKLQKSNENIITIVVPIAIGLIIFVLLGSWAYISKKMKDKNILQEKYIKLLKNGDPEQLKDENEALLGEGEKGLFLPYDSSKEFPFERLVLGSQIGSGEFGRVVKAQARGIISGETQTTVAVKMLKSPPEMVHLKSLMSEAKILAHIGRHPNLLNLLGTCTEKLKYKELYLILEYCHMGNLQQLLIKSRKLFRPYVMIQSLSLGKPVTPKFSPIILDTDERRSMFQNFPSLPQGEEEGQYLNMSGTDSDEILTSGDLFTWSLHVAKGMAYLSEKKVLHGDLACRNILISEDGTAKISDFGLSRDIYYSVYTKRSRTPLPVKWLAPESIQDRIFTTQSDVWSYGITLWEIFSLGVTPYPGMEPGPGLLHYLLSGQRMKCPNYAPGYIYDIMLGCWETLPQKRLTFSRIVELLIREIRLSAHFSGQLSPGFAPNGLSPVVENQAYLTGYPDIVTSAAQSASIPDPLSLLSQEQEPLEDEEGYLLSVDKTPRTAMTNLDSSRETTNGVFFANNDNKIEDENGYLICMKVQERT